MEFNVRKRGAGSAGAILSDASVAHVFGVFGDCCLSRYGFDIREKPSIMSARVLRQVQSFTKEYGEEDAVGIVKTMFGVGHEGIWRGVPIGTSIFSKSYRWLAEKMLIEFAQTRAAACDDSEEDDYVEPIEFISVTL